METIENNIQPELLQDGTAEAEQPAREDVAAKILDIIQTKIDECSTTLADKSKMTAWARAAYFRDAYEELLSELLPLVDEGQLPPVDESSTL